MTDTTPAAPAAAPSAIPTPAEVAANLTAAKAVGGIAFRQQAQRYVDADVPIPFADRQLLASMNRTMPGTPVDDGMRLGGLSPRDARNQVQGDRLLAAGRSIEQVRETLGDPEFEPDDRTPAQREFDRQHNIAPVIDKRSYAAPMPTGETEATWEPVAVDARSLAADLGFTPAAGSTFLQSIFGAAGELAHATDPSAVRGRWEATLTAAFGAKLPEAEARIDAMLKEYAGTSTMAAKLRERGLLRHPVLFTRFHNRALALATWANTRPVA